MKQSYALLALALCAAGTGASAQNFGIGTTSPGSRLSVVSSGGNGGSDDDISLSTYSSTPGASLLINSARGTESSPSDLSAGDQVGSLWFTGRAAGSMHTMSGIRANYIGGADSSDLRFYATNGERMRLTSDGHLGIGTTILRSRFSVVSDGAGGGIHDDMSLESYNSTTSPYFHFRTATGSAASPANNVPGAELGSMSFTTYVNNAWQNSAEIRAFYTGDGTTNLSNLRFYTSGVERLHINQDGYVGIGTNAPGYPLDVNTTANHSHAYAWLTASNGALSTGHTNNSAGNYSIRASGRVLATEFNATSDARLKTIIGRADNAADLATLRGIRITDYRLRDREHGGRIYRKVIAQELETVYPIAVSKSRGFVPTIYAKASLTTSGEGRTAVATPAAHGLKAGDKVRLIGEVNGTVETEVLAVNGPNAFTVALPKAEAALFVYGPEVDDLRTVDYEAIAMLNVSATQALDKKVAELQDQVSSLAAENEALRTQAVAYAELAERVKELQQMLGVNPRTAGAKVGKR